MVLEPGPFEALEVQEATITVDTTGVWGGGPNSADVHLSYWLPSNTQAGEKVPVIAVVSPYFSYGQPGDESNPTNIVAVVVESSFTIILFHTVMHWLRLQFLQPKKARGASIIAVTAKVWAFIRPLNGWAIRIGVMAMLRFMANHTKVQLLGKQRHRAVNISRP